MAFHDREYDVYVVLGGPSAPLPWVQSAWGDISAALDPLMQAARDRPAVRSVQLGPKPGSPNQRSISFGRIGWNDQGARKWCHSENGQLVSGGGAYFQASSVWAPSWTVCERENLAPDVFFSIDNPSPFSPKAGDAIKFSSTCILAVASDLEPNCGEPARQSSVAISTTLQAVARGHCARPWGRSIGGSASFSDAINDLGILGLFKPGPVHVEQPSLAMFRGSWTSF